MELNKLKGQLWFSGLIIFIFGTVILILDSVNVSIVVQYNLESKYTTTASGIWGGFNYMVSGIVIISTVHKFCKYSQYVWLCINLVIAILEGIAIIVLQNLATTNCAANEAGFFVRCNQSVYQLHIATSAFAIITFSQVIIVAVRLLLAHSKFKEAAKN